jgi:hypothetical protein
MKRFLLVGFALAVLGGCHLPSEGAQTRPHNTVAVTQPPADEPSYCFVPEGCDINGHHYEGGQQIRPEGM